MKKLLSSLVLISMLASQVYGAFDALTQAMQPAVVEQHLDNVLAFAEKIQNWNASQVQKLITRARELAHGQLATLDNLEAAYKQLNVNQPAMPAIEQSRLVTLPAAEVPIRTVSDFHALKNGLLVADYCRTGSKAILSMLTNRDVANDMLKPWTMVIKKERYIKTFSSRLTQILGAAVSKSFTDKESRNRSDLEEISGFKAELSSQIPSAVQKLTEAYSKMINAESEFTITWETILNALGSSVAKNIVSANILQSRQPLKFSISPSIFEITEGRNTLFADVKPIQNLTLTTDELYTLIAYVHDEQSHKGVEFIVAEKGFESPELADVKEKVQKQKNYSAVILIKHSGEWISCVICKKNGGEPKLFVTNPSTWVSDKEIAKLEPLLIG